MNDVIKLLESRKVSLNDIAEVTYYLQQKYFEELTMDMCLDAVEKVLAKREVQNAIYTGIAIDVLCEENKLPEPLQTIVKTDEPLYGIDEVLAYGIVNVFGSIGLTNFGYVDKEKVGVIKRLDNKDGVSCNTFLDDIVGAIAASAASKLAHGATEN